MTHTETRLFGLPINGLDNFEAPRARQDWNGFPVPLVAHDIAVQIAEAVGDPRPVPYRGLMPYDGLCWQLIDGEPEIERQQRERIARFYGHAVRR